MRRGMDGNEAISFAMAQIEPDVVFAYPITPQTAIVQNFSQYVADAKVQTLFYNVESEHSAMSACIGAAASGARAMTATCSQGLALMWEMLYIAAGLHLPIVMPVVNRALSAPINIHCDHSDSMGARDSGWVQLYCENAQEGYDLTICAVKIAEESSCPCMVMIDGFIISHNLQPVCTVEDGKVKEFIGEWNPKHHLLNPQAPLTVGAFVLFDYYFEFKRLQQDIFEKASEVAEEVFTQWSMVSGRRYKGIEAFNMEKARYCIVAQGSVCGTIKSVIEGTEDVGLLKITLYRPFPAQALKEILKGVEAVAVMDRCICFGNAGGPLFHDVRSTLYGESVPVKNYIYGLGGRDTSLENIEEVVEDVRTTKRVDEPMKYLGVRE